MAQVIDVPGYGPTEFPDGMSDADIVAAIQKNMVAAPKSTPATVEQKKEEGSDYSWLVTSPAWSLIKGLSSNVASKIERGDILNAEEEVAIRKFLKGAASGPLSGAVQWIAGATGNKDVEQKIADTAKEGSFLGNLAQPEAWLTGKAGAEFVGKGANILSKAVRGGAVSAPYAGLAATPDARDNDLASRVLAAFKGGMSGAAITGALGGGAKIAGWVSDLIKGNQADIKAGKILREIVGGNPQTKALLATAPDDLTAAQAAADVGNTRLSALGERAARNDSQYFSDLAQRQNLARLNQLAGVAGGQTQTAARQTAERSQRNLNGVMTPIRESELAAANTAGEKLGPLTAEAERMGTAAANKVEDVRRFTAASDRAASFDFSPVPGQPRVSTRYNYMGDLSKRAEDVARQSASDSLALGESYRFNQYMADSIGAYGLKPIDTSAVTGKITTSLNNPKYAGNMPAQKALTYIADEIEAWTAKNGGIITAEALDSIRKNGVNSAIESLMGGLSPKAKEKAAAGLTKAVRGPIIDAIESAGGTGYGQYLKDYEAGMKLITQQRLGAKAMELLQKSPKRFMELARGDDPKAIQKLFATEFDIEKAAGKQVGTAIQDVARQLERDKKVKDLGIAGTSDLATMLTAQASKARIPPLFSAKVTMANAVLDAAESSLNAATMAKLYAAMRSGKSATQAMEVLSTVDKNKVLSAMNQGKVTPFMSGGISGMMTGAAQ